MLSILFTTPWVLGESMSTWEHPNHFYTIQFPESWHYDFDDQMFPNENNLLISSEKITLKELMFRPKKLQASFLIKIVNYPESLNHPDQYDPELLLIQEIARRKKVFDFYKVKTNVIAIMPLQISGLSGAVCNIDQISENEKGKLIVLKKDTYRILIDMNGAQNLEIQKQLSEILKSFKWNHLIPTYK